MLRAEEIRMPGSKKANFFRRHYHRIPCLGFSSFGMERSSIVTTSIEFSIIKTKRTKRYFVLLLVDALLTFWWLTYCCHFVIVWLTYGGTWRYKVFRLLLYCWYSEILSILALFVMLVPPKLDIFACRYCSIFSISRFSICNFVC